MQLILLSKDRGHLAHVALSSGRVWLSIVAVAVLGLATLGPEWAGTSLAETLPGEIDPGEAAALLSWVVAPARLLAAGVLVAGAALVAASVFSRLARNDLPR